MTISVNVDARDVGKRLDTFLHEKLPDYSRSRLQSWIRENRVLLNGASAQPSSVLRGGERIEVSPGELPPLKASPEDLPLTILYEDADVVVVDKPAGMVVHAGAGQYKGTLVNALLHRFGQLSNTGGDLRPGIVHRLDKGTSGALVVARDDRSHQALARQFQSRDVEKTYLALVHGHPSPGTATIDKPITRDPVRRTRMTARLNHGRAAHTEFETIERIGSFSLLRVRIGTGRTHQIRVHLASLGHPIVGDTLYGAPREVKEMPALSRFFLHAMRLRFQSPSTGQTIQVESEPAPDLSAWLDQLRIRFPKERRS
jgi:23S rRNA pseudouridine1911/1915/1917 synthase